MNKSTKEAIFPKNWTKGKGTTHDWKSKKVQENICPKCNYYGGRFKHDGWCQFCGSGVMGKKLTAYYENGILMVQRADYIEDGWYIEIDAFCVRLYEIPSGGGKAELIETYVTFQEAYDKAISMT